MAQHQTHSHDEHESHGSLKSYVIGFVLSLILTAIPLIFVLNDIVEGTAANVVLLVTAVLQFVVQLFFFMHLKEEKKPRWNLMALILGLVIVLVIVIGSIWIMGNNEVYQ
ncbi:cytochrome o ubiquinol oxidase subunit IV [Cohnella thailandensis]|jgi:cytochrome o ubiquinol oxidase subunit IV|uniref:Cytochrome o ubiquinol oxidase subunit IV n=1 Tax=Cohnella thailandensis TaxID=557557 RepID=A0A841SWG1_9BACL|nr:cytochrome o ubiquinol oxidase subunit IV [Cohnella thailandensis]MBB6634445.1 cytochrome o ubiquinol oxidase subunit IV [Cohnella thailandensis]MBP1972055.1 cytochrome o ubiquinol oxidase operon protein cyoD [Cohnella thailandensis]